MVADSHLAEAFDEVCADAKVPDEWCLALMERAPFYGGPQEGGWYGEDQLVVKYKWFKTKEEAEAAKEQVEKLAKKLTDEARTSYGKQCLRETAWLDARMLDDDFLPQPDGHSEYWVRLEQDHPKDIRGNRNWD